MPRTKHASDPEDDAKPALLPRLRCALPGLEPGLEVIGEALPSRDGPIDLLAHDAEGRLVVVLIASGDEPGDTALLFTRALATRDWLAGELPGWLQLRTDLDVGPDTPVRCLLFARSFDATTRAAAAALPGGWIDLAIYRPFVHAGDAFLLVEHDAVGPRDVHRSAAPSWRHEVAREPDANGEPRSLPVLRSGISEADFRLSGPERRSLTQGSAPRPRYSEDQDRPAQAASQGK